MTTMTVALLRKVQARYEASAALHETDREIRNAHIIAAFDAGMQPVAIAAATGLTRARVWQIIGTRATEDD